MNKKILTLISYFKNPLFSLDLSLGRGSKEDFTIYIAYIAKNDLHDDTNEREVLYCGKAGGRRPMFPIPGEKDILLRIKKTDWLPFKATLSIKKDRHYVPVLIKDNIYSGE